MRTSPISHACIAAITLTASAAFTSAANAAQAFLCENGKILHVAQQDLALLKRTNTCVANHFGIKLPAPSQHNAKQTRIATILIPPLPVRRQPTTVAKTHGTLAPAPRRSRATTLASTSTTVLSKISVSTTRPERAIDYRNVTIINATPGARQIFQHQY